MNAPLDDTSANPPGNPDIDEAFRLWRAPLARYAMSLGTSRGLPSSADSAEDVVQQAFEAALRTEWSTIRYPRAWLYAVTRNLVLALASRYYREMGPSGARGSDITWSSMARVPSADVQFAVNQATRELASLPTQRRTVFYLHDVLGWSHLDIARELSISDATARAHLFHARGNLREIIPEAALPAIALSASLEWAPVTGPDFPRAQLIEQEPSRLRRTLLVVALVLLFASGVVLLVAVSWIPGLAVLLTACAISGFVLWRRGLIDRFLCWLLL
ncbi:RNA polymerase sigma factor [Amycolatopsis sp. lyj-112]|uniref:RNA polymerase sigma factor n=1 Tax=Amycolatopsis sp. lyj-112 TaxID=2789288 RepID=UPI00397C1193